MAERDSTTDEKEFDRWREANPVLLGEQTDYAAPGQAIATGGPAGCSPSIARLATALAKAQGQLEGASKDQINPHFGKGYAGLASIWAACREPLTVNELAVIQQTSAEGSLVTVTSILAHSSGEWVRSELTMKAQTETPQSIGSCITYARRYALAALVGVAPEDDDGNEASSAPVIQRSTTQPVATISGKAVEKFEDMWTDLTSAADEGIAALDVAWTAMPVAFKNFVLEHRLDQRTALKAKAAAVTKAAAEKK